MKIPKVNVKQEYIKFEGGLDLETPVLSLAPGAMLVGLNYIPATEGGYRRVDGYEIYDGQASPSDGVYYYCPVSLSATVSVGNTITGVTSGATGEVIVSRTGVLCVTKVTGTFDEAAENITVGGVVKGAVTAVPSLEGEPTGLLDATALNLAADVYRADISAPTGSGAILGLGILDGTLYCFVNNAGGTAGLIYKATAAGWVAVTLLHELSFVSGTGGISDDDTITQLTSTATAKVKRVVLESGAWADSDAAGRLILDDITGTFNNTNDLQVGGATKATSNSAAVQITIVKGGRYEIITHNFYATTGTMRMYGCNGEGRGFEFDGTVYVPISTGMTVDKPEYVYAHKSQLFFSFDGGSSQNSGVGLPYEWTPVTGATEIGLGEDIVGYLGQVGDVLAIFTRNSTSQLSGSTIADFELKSISPDTGAIPRTVRNFVGSSFCLDDKGIIDIRRSEVYGNFEQSAVSQKIREVINDMRKVVVASAVYRSHNQYRLYGSDGTGICMTFTQKTGRSGESYTSYSFAQFEYSDNVACTVVGEDSNGAEVVFLGDDAGNVYQADKGSSFNGADIEAYLAMPFNSSKSPGTLKTYRKVTIDMTASAYSVIQFHPDFSYGDPSISQPLAAEMTTEEAIQGRGGYWDGSYWDTFFLDATLVSNPSFPVNGDGVNLGLAVYSKSQIDLGHKLDAAVIQYTLRRLVR